MNDSFFMSRFGFKFIPPSVSLSLYTWITSRKRSMIMCSRSFSEPVKICSLSFNYVHWELRDVFCFLRRVISEVRKLTSSLMA